MFNFGDVKGFNKLKTVAEDCMKQKALTNVRLSENDKCAISNWISGCKNNINASNITGLSQNYISKLKHKKADTMRGSTHEIFQRILLPQESANPDDENIQGNKIDINGKRCCHFCATYGHISTGKDDHCVACPEWVPEAGKTREQECAEAIIRRCHNCKSEAVSGDGYCGNCTHWNEDLNDGLAPDMKWIDGKLVNHENKHVSCGHPIADCKCDEYSDKDYRDPQTIRIEKALTENDLKIQPKPVEFEHFAKDTKVCSEFEIMQEIDKLLSQVAHHPTITRILDYMWDKHV